MGRLRIIVIGATATIAVVWMGAAVSFAATKPPGYMRVVSAVNVAPAGGYVLPSTATCPTGTVLWGGGVTFSGGTAGAGQNIVSTLPAGNATWFAQYNNASANTVNFVSDAICATKPAGYKIVFKSVDDPAGSMVGRPVTCPTGRVLLSGGAQTTADNPGSWLLSEGPISSKRFRAVNYNGTGVDETLTAYAVCADQPPGYKIVTANFTDRAGPDTVAGAAVCPPGTIAVGGGTVVIGPNPLVSLGGEMDESGGMEWSYELVNTLTGGAVKIRAKAVCAD